MRFRLWLFSALIGRISPPNSLYTFFTRVKLGTVSHYYNV
nr:MAG TPA: hypothetical protein [Caudoviricetes sp.]